MKLNEKAVVNTLQDLGVLLFVSIRWWRGRKKLAPEDVNLKPEAVDSDLISLGQKHLTHPARVKKFAVLESRARAALGAAGFPFCGMARYVPNTTLDGVLQRLYEIKDEFDREAADFTTNYATIRTESLEMWKSYAAERKMPQTEFMSVIDAAFPAEKAIASKFEFSVITFQVVAPGKPTVETAAANARVRATREAEDQIRAASKAFIDECVTQLRTETADLCESVLRTIQGNESTSQRTIDRLTTFIDRFAELNFAGDDVLEAKLATLKAQILPAQEYRDDPRKQATLEGTLRQLREEAVKLAAEEPAPAILFGETTGRKIRQVDTGDQ